MKGIVGRTKRYVTVVSQTDETGEVTPLTIVWEDGRRYGIDRVLDRRQAHSLKTGGTGIRYTVRVPHPLAIVQIPSVVGGHRKGEYYASRN